MAIRANASGEQYTRGTNLPSVTANTIMGWFRIDSSTGDNQCFWELAVGVDGYQASYQNSGGVLSVYNGAGGAGGSALSTETWYHVCSTVSGTGASGYLTYLNGVLDITYDARAAATPDHLLLFDDGFGNPFNGRAAAIKMWGAVLTVAEIVNEMRQYLPCRTANLNGFYPLLSLTDDQVDYSGQGNALTPAGTLSVEDGPPIPWRRGQSRFTYIAGAAPGGLSIPVAMHDYRRRRVA